MTHAHQLSMLHTYVCTHAYVCMYVRSSRNEIGNKIFCVLGFKCTHTMKGVMRHQSSLFDVHPSIHHLVLTMLSCDMLLTYTSICQRHGIGVTEEGGRGWGGGAGRPPACDVSCDMYVLSTGCTDCVLPGVGSTVSTRLLGSLHSHRVKDTSTPPGQSSCMHLMFPRASVSKQSSCLLQPLCGLSVKYLSLGKPVCVYISVCAGVCECACMCMHACMRNARSHVIEYLQSFPSNACTPCMHVCVHVCTHARMHAPKCIAMSTLTKYVFHTDIHANGMFPPFSPTRT